MARHRSTQPRDRQGSSVQRRKKLETQRKNPAEREQQLSKRGFLKEKRKG